MAASAGFAVHADDAAGDDGPLSPPAAEPVRREDEAARHAIDRTWLYADDARLPAPLTVVAMVSSSYTDVGPSPFNVGGVTISTRYHAFDANTAPPGVLFSAGGELGIIPRVSVVATGQFVVGGETSHPNGGAVAGVRVLVTPPSWQHLHLVLSAGYLREAWEGPVYDDDSNKWVAGNPDGDNGAWFQGAISGDIGRLRLVGNVHGEHIFANGRDPLDVMVDLGATYQVVGKLRLASSGSGRIWKRPSAPAAEGGARMFADRSPPTSSSPIDSPWSAAPPSACRRPAAPRRTSSVASRSLTASDGARRRRGAKGRSAEPVGRERTSAASLCLAVRREPSSGACPHHHRGRRRDLLQRSWIGDLRDVGATKNAQDGYVPLHSVRCARTKIRRCRTLPASATSGRR